MFGGSLFALLYLIIGAVVASRHGYVITSLVEALFFMVAMILWPLVLLGVNLRIAI
jgi:hypothetical protein